MAAARRGASRSRHGYLDAASSAARVRLSPTLRAVGRERLRLEPGEQPQGLGVALEPADVGGGLVERRLAVVAERRVAEVVGEARRFDDVGVAAEGVRELAPDLGDLERVGQPVADEVAARRPDDLRLGGQPAQGAGVHDRARSRSNGERPDRLGSGR